jgi:hypothetical protein
VRWVSGTRTDTVVREIWYFSASFLYEQDSPRFRDLISVREASRAKKGKKVSGVARVVIRPDW